MLHHTHLLLQCVGLVHLPFPDFFPTHLFIPLGCSLPWPGGKGGIHTAITLRARGQPRGDGGSSGRAQDGVGGCSLAKPGTFPVLSPPCPGARRRWRCRSCRRSPARPGPALPRLGRGNDLRGNLGRAGRARGSGRAGDVPAAGGHSGGGRQVGGAAPGSPCPARGSAGLLSPGSASSPSGGPRACAAARAPGLRWFSCPGKRRLGAGVST